MNYSDNNEQHSVATHRANQIIQQMGKKSSYTKHDYSTLIALMCFVCYGGVQIKEQWLLQSHMIVHQLAGQKLCFIQINPIHLALEYDCLNVWNFMTQFPRRFFRSGIKWSRSLGNHLVLAETSMIRLNVPHIKHHSYQRSHGQWREINCLHVFSVCVCVCVLKQNKPQKKNFTRTVVFSNPDFFPASRRAHHFITPPAVSAL